MGCGKFKFATANSNSLQKTHHGKFNITQQIQIHSDKFKFTTQIHIRHGKLKFTTGNSNSPRQVQIRHWKFKFTAAISNFHSNFKCATVNSISLRQIEIHHVKFKFAAANLNSLRLFQIRQSHFKFSTANSVSQECRYELQGEGQRGTARVGLGHHTLSYFIYQLWNIYIKFPKNEFDFSAWLTSFNSLRLTHFV